MYASRFDRVIVAKPLNPEHAQYINYCGLVINTNRLDPMTVLVRLDTGEEVSFYHNDLHVIPPQGTLFQYNDEVKIIKDYGSTTCHISKVRLIGKTGYVRAYDKRDSCYKIDTHDDEGWFPPGCIVPIEFLGDHFYLPGEYVTYKEKKFQISEIKLTHNLWGQLLLLESEWIPSSDVKLYISKNSSASP